MAAIVEKKERKVIKIKTAGKATPFGTGGGEKLSFAGEDGVSYTTFAKSLFEYLMVGVEVDVDVELRKSGEYSNWIIVQMYKDNKPLVEKGKSWSGSSGGGYRGKSPEEIRSIEDQVRVKAITELWAVGTIGSDDLLVTKLRKWLDMLGQISSTTSEPKPTPAPAPESKPAPAPVPKEETPPVQPKLDEEPKEEKPEPKADTPVTKETLATLKSTVEASKYKNTPLAITSILEMDFGVKKAKELSEPRAIELIEGLNKGKWDAD